MKCDYFPESSDLLSLVRKYLGLDLLSDLPKEKISDEQHLQILHIKCPALNPHWYILNFKTDNFLLRIGT